MLLRVTSRPGGVSPKLDAHGQQVPCYSVFSGLWLVEKIIEKKYDAENKPKVYSTHQFLSTCFQFHISIFLRPVCMQ